MNANELSKELSKLAEAVRAAVQNYLDATEHNHMPSLEVQYTHDKMVGSSSFTASVTAKATIVAES